MFARNDFPQKTADVYVPELFRVAAAPHVLKMRSFAQQPTGNTPRRLAFVPRRPRRNKARSLTMNPSCRCTGRVAVDTWNGLDLASWDIILHLSPAAIR